MEPSQGSLWVINTFARLFPFWITAAFITILFRTNGAMIAPWHHFPMVLLFLDLLFFIFSIF